MRTTDLAVGRLRATFKRAFGRAKPFTSFELRVLGVSDGVPGVQWNAWHNIDSRHAFLGVNLEGTSSPGWPLPTFLTQELVRPLLFCVIDKHENPESVEVRLWRDVWIAGVKHRSVGDELRPTPVLLSRLTGGGWQRALRAAFKCTDTTNAGHGFGRADIVLLSSGGKRSQAMVSPHLQFKTLLWESEPESVVARAKLMNQAIRRLRPVYGFVRRRSRRRLARG
jgi:hypothetical protein